MDVNFASLKLRTDAQPVTLLKELALSPLIYIRLVGILFSIIVFGCMADKGYLKSPGGDEACYYNGSGACSYALAIGVLAFLLCIVFLIKDVMMVVIDFSGSIVIKKAIIIIDISVNGLWAFLWFVAFCFTADQYRRSDLKSYYSTAVNNCLRATITFSFFSIILWISIIVLNILFLIWIFKGTDRDCKPSAGGYSGFEGQDEDNKDEPEDLVPSGPRDNVYTPPEY